MSTHPVADTETFRDMDWKSVLTLFEGRQSGFMG